MITCRGDGELGCREARKIGSWGSGDLGSSLKLPHILHGLLGLEDFCMENINRNLKETSIHQFRILKLMRYIKLKTFPSN